MASILPADRQVVIKHFLVIFKGPEPPVCALCCRCCRQQVAQKRCWQLQRMLWQTCDVPGLDELFTDLYALVCRQTERILYSSLAET